MSFIGNSPTTSNFPVDYFTGTGSTSSFNLSQFPASASSIIVSVNGSKLVSSPSNPEYYLNGNILVVNTPPALDATIEVVYLGVQSLVNVPGDLTVTQSMLSSNLTLSGNTSITGNLNLASGKTYKINGTDVLTGSALGSGITSSSLTSVGTLSSLSVSGTTSLANVSYTGTLTGGTGILNIGSGQIYKDANGKILIGSTSVIGTSGDNLQILQPSVAGITIATSTTPTNGTSFTGIGAYAYDGSSYFVGGTINFRADENWSTTNHGSLIQFRLIPSGSGGTLREVARIDSAGNLGIGTSSPWSKLWVEKPGVDLSTFSFEDASCSSHLTLAGNPTYVRLHLGTMSISPFAGYIQTSYDNTPGNSGTGSSGANPLLLNPKGGYVGINTTNTPTSPLYIEHPNFGTEPYSAIYIKNTGTSGQAYTGITVDGYFQSHYRYALNGTVKWQTRVGAATGIDDFRIYSWTKGLDVLTIDNTGLLSLAQGQIKFPATQVASADANTLDDYEEGTWTPQLGGVSSTFSMNQGTYIKIGRMVYAFWDFTVSSRTGTWNNQITGLPFTISSSMAGYSVINHRDANLFAGVVSGAQLKGYAERGTSYMVVQTDNSGSGFGTSSPPAINSSGRSTGYIIYESSN
jgi:hypothetical protein